jgi:hypothetical protein
MICILEFWGYALSWVIGCCLHPPPVSPVTLSMECWEHRQVGNVFASEVAAPAASSLFAHQKNEQEKGFQHLPTNLQNVTPVSLWQPTGKIGTVQQCTRFGSSVPRLMQLRRLVGSLSKSYLTAGRVWYPVNCNVFNSTCSPAAPKKTSSWHWPACEVLLHNQCSK